MENIKQIHRKNIKIGQKPSKIKILNLTKNNVKHY